MLGRAAAGRSFANQRGKCGMARAASAVSWRGWSIVVVLSGCLVGCHKDGGDTEPQAKGHLRKLLALYQVYGEKNSRGPPDERALRDFGQKLTAKERDEYLIGDDIDGLFTSPRDKQKYVIVYNVRLDPGGATRAIAWEADSQGGKRYVALSVGYVEEYDD